MLQYRQNFTLNHILYRFVADIKRNYGHRASFECFHLTAISQGDQHASVQITGQMILFDQL